MSTDYSKETDGNLSSQQSTQVEQKQELFPQLDSPTLNALDKTENIQRKQFFPPPNSKAYKIKSAKQSLEISTTDDDLNTAMDALKTYKTQLLTISAQNKVVDQNLTNFSDKNEEIISQLETYKKQLEKCGDTANEFYQIDSYISSQNIDEIQTKFQSTVESLDKASKQLNNDAKNLCDRKRKFESNLSFLEREEKRLNFVRKKLQEAHSQLGIFTQFSEANLSRQYFRKVHENDLSDLFLQGNVSNVYVHLESDSVYKEINIRNNVYVNKLHVTSDGVQFLKINIQNTECGITFNDCSFSRVGLLINGRHADRNNGSIALVNLNVVDAPQHGIRLMFCGDCSVNTSSVKGVANGSGIVFEHVGNSQIDGVDVEDCKLNGFLFDNSNAVMMNCTTAYCAGYAVCVKDNSAVSGNNNQFNSNGGDTIGNFTQK